MTSVFARRFLRGVGIAAAVGCVSCTEPNPDPGSAHASFPQLSNFGGHLLTPFRLVAVATADDPLRDSLFAFAKALPSSRWWREVATPYGISATATAVTVTGPPIAPGTMTFSDVSAYLQSAAINGAGYQPDGRTLYLFWLPPGVKCSGGSSQCDQYTAFHAPFAATNAISLVTRSATGTPSVVASMTVTASHEIIESVTDPEWDAWKLQGPNFPWTGDPWALDDGGSFEENADLCSGTRYQEGGFYYQRNFTNPAAASGGDPFVPALLMPYYNVTTSHSWFSTSGETTITLTGWSTAPTANWQIVASAGPRSSQLAAPAVSLSCADTTRVNGTAYCTINRGKTVTLRVTLPAGTPSKTYATVRVSSFRFDAAGQRPPLGEDISHRWIFGVYVP